MRIAVCNTHITPAWTELLEGLANDVEVVLLGVNDDIVDAVLEADVIVFTGGADISPDLYGEAKRPASNVGSRNRDMHELAVARLASQWGVAQVGICRGAQLLCVANGGKLIQDINNHMAKHSIVTVGKKEFQVSSTHHQGMVPMGRYVILGWAGVATRKDGIPKGYINTDSRDKDVEVVWWDETNALGFQFHPEYMSKEDEGYKYFVDTVKEMINEMKA